MKTVTVIVQIKVDETTIKEKYPNYRFNWDTPEAFIEHLTDGLETTTDYDNVPFNHMEEYGFEIKVLTREQAKVIDLDLDIENNN